ncbi:hypothetical protein BX661DRAFT_172300 [Kickxella alabastrina]|uniref:uncharacterized protein n=1 Tax=Kickxella alabastrina TaxID=61397 RepID=UPI0022202C74|nr:uncharacterized protein BX661DRAFT_172300 [Kickxella alabastrina]KAI7824470.1 hypothetical protein BX661DRAFT_172300 [Kickxella alabastrina]
MRLTATLSSAELLLFAIAGIVVNATETEEDRGLDNFLRIRPDLSNALNPQENGNRGDDTGVNEPAEPRRGLGGQLVVDPNIKKQQMDIECVEACDPTDQGCRAKCLGVPGGSKSGGKGVLGGKKERDSGEEGGSGLPIGWRKNKAVESGSSSSSGAVKVGGRGFEAGAGVLELVGIFGGMVLVLGCPW